MIKARVDRLEKAFGGIEEPWKGEIRIAPFYDDEPIPIANPGEELILLHVVTTPHRSEGPTNGGGTIAEADLVAEVARLERERDELIGTTLTSRASDKKTRDHPRAAAIGVEFPDWRGRKR